MARAARATALATRVTCNKEYDGYGSKSNGNRNKDGRQVTAMRAMATAMAATWAMVTATRVADDKRGIGEGGKGSKGNGNNDEGGG